MQDNKNEKRLWRRTRLTRADGSPIPDDWTLEDDAGQPLGRIYAETGGPRGGRWFWAVLVAPDGTPFNGGTGHTETGREAREAVEALIPEGLSTKRPSRALPHSKQ
jgi:hypothetical protein